jgi:uncharacterized membrane protein
MMSIVDANPGAPLMLQGALATGLALHIAGGSVAIVAGYGALMARKGRPLHRVLGQVFIVAMLVMALFAAVIGVATGKPGNAFAALLLAYLLGTSWAAVAPRRSWTPRFERLAMLLAVGLAAVGVIAPILGLNSSAGAGGSFIFALLAGFSAAQDLKAIRGGGIAGPERLRRHLWRMCTAMFVATGSFFLGQMDEIPRALHGPHLWLLAFGPLAALVLWMNRTRPRPRLGPVLAAS